MLTRKSPKDTRGARYTELDLVRENVCIYNERRIDIAPVYTSVLLSFYFKQLVPRFITPSVNGGYVDAPLVVYANVFSYQV